MNDRDRFAMNALPELLRELISELEPINGRDDDLVNTPDFERVASVASALSYRVADTMILARGNDED